MTGLDWKGGTTQKKAGKSPLTIFILGSDSISIERSLSVNRVTLCPWVQCCTRISLVGVLGLGAIHRQRDHGYPCLSVIATVDAVQ